MGSCPSRFAVILKLTTVVTSPLASTVILIESACGLDPTQVPTSSAGTGACVVVDAFSVLPESFVAVELLA